MYIGCQNTVEGNIHANLQDPRLTQTLSTRFRKNSSRPKSVARKDAKLLARLAAKYDYEQIGQARLTNDTLLAMSAGRRGITIITTNERDFGRLAQFHPFQWQVPLA